MGIFKSNKKNVGKNEKEIVNNWLIVRVGGEHFVKNLIIDERMFALMAMMNSNLGEKTVWGKYLGLHQGEDGKVYYVVKYDDKIIKDYFDLDYYKKFNEKLDVYVVQLKKIMNNIKDGSREYNKFQTYLSKSRVKELKIYTNDCDKNKNIDMVL